MQTVSRVAAVLRALAQSDRKLGVADVAKVTGLPIGSAHRMLIALAEEDLISRSGTSGRFSISAGLFGIAFRGFERKTLMTLAEEPLGRLRDKVGETAFVSQLIGDSIICTNIANADRPVRLSARVGQEVPLHAAAAARVILAYEDPTRARQLLLSMGFKQFRTSTPSTIENIADHLVSVRRRGFDICDDELDEGVWAVAAPIRVAEIPIAASLTVAAPAFRISGSAARTRVRRIVCRVASEIESSAWTAQQGLE